MQSIWVLLTGITPRSYVDFGVRSLANAGGTPFAAFGSFGIGLAVREDGRKFITSISLYPNVQNEG